MVRRALLTILIAGWSAGFAQTPEQKLSFEAASIKPAAPLMPDGRGMIRMMGPSGGPGTKDPGRINYPGVTLKYLLFTAYDVKPFQVSGPSIIDTERFDIVATMPPGTTKEQFRIMLQNLLAERFGLKMHRDSKEMAMYSLTVTKGGPKMKPSQGEPTVEADAPFVPPPGPPGPPKMGADGFPDLLPVGGRPGIFNIMMPGRAKMVAQWQSMHDLAERLSNQLSKPVVDETGLAGKYDFTLIYLPEQMTAPMGMAAPPPPPPPAGGAGPVTGGGDGRGPGGTPDSEPVPTLVAALQSQLGLKLDAKKGPVPIIVVDHVEKTPTDN